jgi:hypothetical protein
MINRVLLLALLSTGFAFAAPENSARPGGVAFVDLGSVEQAAPAASFDDKRVLVMRDGDRWKAVVGIPLDTEPGSLTVSVGGDKVTVPIIEHAYAEQRLTVKNQSHVTPDQAQLDRIGSERKIIDAALNNFRQVPVETISLAAPVDGPRGSSFSTTSHARRTKGWTLQQPKACRSPHR